MTLRELLDSGINISGDCVAFVTLAEMEGYDVLYIANHQNPIEESEIDNLLDMRVIGINMEDEVLFFELVDDNN